MSELLGSPGGPGIERACLLWMLLTDGDLAILGLPGPCPPPPPAPDAVLLRLLEPGEPFLLLASRRASA